MFQTTSAFDMNTAYFNLQDTREHQVIGLYILVLLLNLSENKESLKRALRYGFLLLEIPSPKVIIIHLLFS